MIKSCEICGREFVAKRSTAKYCSPACRKRKERGYAYVGEIQPPVPSASMPKEEVAAVIQGAHNIASDLSRASMLTPAPLCLSLKRVARRIEEALRGEGL